MQLPYLGLLLLTSMLWAGNFVAGKYMVGHATAIVLTDFRWAIAVLCLIPIVWQKERKLLPPRQAFLPLFVMGLTGVVLFNAFMFLALERTTSGNVGLLSALNPVAIAIASYFILREKLNAQKILGMIVSFCGVLVVISNGKWEMLVHFRFNSGDLFMLAAVASWGIYSVAGRKSMQYASPLMSTTWAGIFGVIMLIPFSITSFSVKEPDFAFWVAVLYVSIGATVAGMLFWNIGVQKVGGTKSGMFLNFNPIFTAVLAYFLLGEKTSYVQLLGTFLVISGVLLFTVQRNVLFNVKRTENKTA